MSRKAGSNPIQSSVWVDNTAVVYTFSWLECLLKYASAEFPGLNPTTVY